MPGEMRIVLRNQGQVDPFKIEDYMARGGYQALKKARAMKRNDLISEVRESKLRGRGGAGFNCGQKWFFAASAENTEKYVVCNADEGEPGTYKDRIIIQHDPHSLIEGMLICAYAINGSKGYIYLRGEYSYLGQVLNHAIAQASDHGLLDGFDLTVRRGAGAYVCGEETALIESLEGKRGEPRYKPPFPPVQGLWGKPTIVNNVETLANIPVIVEKGAQWFSAIGAPNYPGTKLFTLTGDVNRKTFFEVPSNTTIRDLVFKYGEGIPGGKRLKAVQIGGNSGAFIPENLLDTQVDFDSMNKAGLTLGSGAVLVMDETRDILDVITRIEAFFEHESCGKCTPCREGTPRLVGLLEKIRKGDGSHFDLDLMQKLGRIMSRSSLCGLGMAAPVPLLTAIQHFPNAFEAKVSKKTSEEGSPW
jgi:NADH-quinone oxidoreductase subunit F